MATTTLRADSALANPNSLPTHFPPMPDVARILARFDREQLHGFIEVAIDLADAMDGDSEAEPDCSEDDAVMPPWWGDYRGEGAGCPISDPGGCEHDGREEEQGL